MERDCQRNLLLPWHLKINEKSFYTNRIHQIESEHEIVFIFIGVRGMITFSKKIANLTETLEKHYYLNQADEILTVTNNSFQTYALNSNGELYKFDSIKKVRSIMDSDGDSIQFFGCFKDKCVVLKKKGSNLIILIYDSDGFSDSKSPLQTLEINGPADVISLESSSIQDTYCLQLFTVSKYNINFFKNLVSFGAEIQENSEIIIFSISCKLFLVQILSKDDDYMIETIGNFLANIEDFQLFQINESSTVLLVLTENSILTFFKFNQLLNTVDRREIFLSGNLNCHEFIPRKHLFVYSTEKEITEIRFEYCEIEENVNYQTKSQRFLGIQAFTYVSRLNALVSINRNNMIYLIKLQQSNYNILNESPNFREFDDNMLASVEQLTNSISHETERKKLIENKFNTILKRYRNLEIFDTILKNTQITMKISSALQSFQYVLKTNLVFIEFTCDSPCQLDDLKILIECYDQKRQISTKKISKIKNSLNLSDNFNLISINLKNVKVQAVYAITPTCMKYVKL